MKKVILSILILTGAFACRQENIDLYSNDASGASVYFPMKETNGSGDVYFSFGYIPSGVHDTAIQIPVRILGAPTAYDRPYNLKVMDTSTATAEMASIENKNLVIPAGKTADTLVIRLKRVPAIQAKSYMLNLELHPNEHFSNSYLTNKLPAGSTQAPREYTKIRVQMDDIVGAPDWWRQGNAAYSIVFGYFGAYSSRKFQLLLTYYNLDPKELTVTNWPQLSGNLYRIIAYASGLKAYLNMLQAQGTPLLEADGTPMKMGTSAK